MPRFLLSLFGLFLWTISHAQSAQKEINDQVWTPFLEAYASGDVSQFMSVHAHEVLRIPQDENKIIRFKDYQEHMQEVNNYNQQNGYTVSLQLRFIQRLAQDDRAFEAGIYEYQRVDKAGKVDKFYGKFHVVLIKENNRWKIWLDADTSEGASEQTFRVAKSMADF